VDAELETGNIDIQAIEAAITDRTRGIVVVHYLGVPVDMPRVTEIARKYGLFLLEDCALALGARVAGKHVGLHGDAGVFSFYPVKHITTAEGGMIIVKDRELADRLKLLRAFGVDRSHQERKIPGVYDATNLGFNYRMSEIHAAIGTEQLKKLSEFLERRRENFAILSNAIGSLPGSRVLPQPVRHQLESSHYCLALLLEASLMSKRPGVMSGLSDQGIGSSVYYPQPVPRMTWYREKYGYDEARYQNAAHISDSMIALPVGPHLNTEAMHAIADTLREVIEKQS
jgi:dTDP-4-amino-4,6-dideoxygalactose transaminase